MKLLIVDDEPLTRKGLITSIKWTTLGVTQIFEADNGLSALEIAYHEKPELIMCDIHMPRMTGIQIAEKLESFLPNTSLIFMSGYSDKEYLKAAIKLKAISYIDKPLNSNEVKESVLEAIKCHHQKELSCQNNTLYSLEIASQLALLLTKPYKENQNKIHFLIDQLGLDLLPNCSYLTYIVHLRTSESNTLIFNTIYSALSELLLGYHLNVLYIQSHTHYHIYHIVGNQTISHILQTTIENFLKDHFTSFKDFFIGHSNPSIGISRAYQSYCSVVVLMQSSFFFQSGTILSPQESVFSCTDLLTSAISTEPWIDFNEALSTKNQFACSELLSQLFKSYYQNFILLPNQVKDIYYKLFITLNENCKKLRFSINSSEESIMESLENCFTYQELHQILTNKVNLFFNTLHNYKPEDSTIFLIKDYVNKHYAEDNLSIKEISNHVFLSISYVCTYFKNQTGQTLNQYITDYRMEKAIQLLADTRYQIVDISFKVGYSNGNYFSKSFKKYTGLSPSRYREITQQ